MTDTCLNIITRLTVELHKDDISKEKLGTGVLYTNQKLSGVVYVLTAKHCLSKLGEKGRVSTRLKPKPEIWHKSYGHFLRISTHAGPKC